MTESTLRDVLTVATDQIESPDLAAAALKETGRRRTRRRAALAAAASAVLVGSIAVAVALVETAGTNEPAPGVPTPPPISEDAPRRWDPRNVDDLPGAPDAVAPLLPEVIDPPPSAKPLVEAPLGAAVLTINDGRMVFLLSTENEWRSIPVPERYAQVSLSRSGTGLVFLTGDGLQVWDLTSGEKTVVPFPEDLVPWDFIRVKWIDESTLLLDDLDGGWLVDVSMQTTQRVPYPTESVWAIDGDGIVVESADYEDPVMFTDWAGGNPRRIGMTQSGRLERLVATTDTIIGTTYDGGPFRVVVADRSDLTPVAVLPVRDHEANYSNWALGPVAVQSDGTVLIWVAVVGPDDGWRLVAWDPGSGDLAVVSRSDAVPTDSVSYAVDLLR